MPDSPTNKRLWLLHDNGEEDPPEEWRVVQLPEVDPRPSHRGLPQVTVQIAGADPDVVETIANFIRVNRPPGIYLEDLRLGDESRTLEFSVDLDEMMDALHSATEDLAIPWDRRGDGS